MKSVFLDTNIILYMIDRRDQAKTAAVFDLVHRLHRQASISVQVLQETYWAATRKLGVPPNEARELVESWSKRRVFQPGPDDVINAIDTSERYRISFWDAMIVEAAAALGCDVIYSEDLSHNQVMRGVRIQSPFQ